MKRQSPHRPRAAFTLIEVLVVVAIISMLAALGFAGVRFAQNQSREKDTIALIRDITRAIESYKDDNGAYPRPALDEEPTTVNGESWIVGGAKMLYQVLSGDGNDSIKGGEKVSNGLQGSAKDDKDPTAGKVYMDTIVAPTKQQIEDKKHTKYVDNAGEAYYVVDPWRHPLRYVVPERDKNGLVTSTMEMHSSGSFELWSYGNSKKAQEDAESQEKWITNWGQR